MLEIKEALTYDPISGVLYFKDTGLPIKTHNTCQGYFGVSYDGVSYLAHRLIFLLVDGTLPEKDVDHINGIKTDNRFSNLRKVTRQQNTFNRSKNLNKDLPKNVYLHKPSGRYQVKMKINKETRHFGYYDDLELAEFVAQEVQAKYHGEYARKV